MNRTIIIGDAHGCSVEIEILLNKCNYEAGDEVVFVGDIVGRGPDSKGVLDIARSVEARSVLGNHEDAWLRWRRRYSGGGSPARVGPLETAKPSTLGPDEWAYLESLPLEIRLPEYRIVVVHAGLDPGVPLDRQKREDLLNIRTVMNDGTPSYESQNGTPWGCLWKGPETVVFGHHARRGIQRHQFAIGLDSGCVYGGHLTAYLLPDNKLLSVAAERTYVAK